MAKFQILKTISYDLYAEVNIKNAKTAEEALEILEDEGDHWIKYKPYSDDSAFFEVTKIESKSLNKEKAKNKKVKVIK